MHGADWWKTGKISKILYHLFLPFYHWTQTIVAWIFRGGWMINRMLVLTGRKLEFKFESPGLHTFYHEAEPMQV